MSSSTCCLWIGADSDSGPSEIEWLTILQVDDCGELAAAVTFAPDDLDAAWAELDARYDAGEAAPFVATWRGMRQQLPRSPRRARSGFQAGKRRSKSWWLPIQTHIQSSPWRNATAR
jgi:hypothetical protein